MSLDLNLLCCPPWTSTAGSVANPRIQVSPRIKVWRRRTAQWLRPGVGFLGCPQHAPGFVLGVSSKKKNLHWHRGRDGLFGLESSQIVSDPFRSNNSGEQLPPSECQMLLSDGPQWTTRTPDRRCESKCFHRPGTEMESNNAAPESLATSPHLSKNFQGELLPVHRHPCLRGTIRSGTSESVRPWRRCASFWGSCGTIQTPCLSSLESWNSYQIDAIWTPGCRSNYEHKRPCFPRTLP